MRVLKGITEYTSNHIRDPPTVRVSSLIKGYWSLWDTAVSPEARNPTSPQSRAFRCHRPKHPDQLLISDANELGTQKAHKHKHLMAISLPYWASF